MTCYPTKNRVVSTLVFTLLGVAAAAAPTAGSKPKGGDKPGDSKWVFSLLPKSLQKNPRLELTVITEMTEAGKKAPEVSPAKPAYFETFSAGYHALGERIGNEHALAEADVTKLLMQSLGSSGYLPARRPEHPPTLMVVYTWGTHNLYNEADPENPSLPPAAIAANMLDRAALVGGAKFAAHLRELFQQANDIATANYTPPSDPTGLVPDQQPIMGPAQMDMMNPVQLFKRTNEKNEFLVDQAAQNVFYVVATAYDYQSVSSGRRIMLWRTRMTVASDGISQDQGLPPLVLAAGPYFGKEMLEPEIISKRAVPEGSVELGTPTVVESGTEHGAGTAAKK